MSDINALRSIFISPTLLDLALTHRSWINENPGIRGSNERLEFLGDAILEFIVSLEIYSQFQDKEEGYLTSLRASLVNTQNLSMVAKTLGLGPALFLSKGEDEGGGRENSSLLADTVEAIIGALYLDQGLEAVTRFIKENILVDVDARASQPLKDSKSRLQEEVQAKGFTTPRYRVVTESGPDHAKMFVVEVLVDTKQLGLGQGKSKSEAEQSAAQNALAELSQKLK